jgi:hypothetical protein
MYHIIKDLLPAGTEVRHAPTLSLSASGSGRRSRSGDQIVIVSSNWSSSFYDSGKMSQGQVCSQVSTLRVEPNVCLFLARISIGLSGVMS